MLQKIIDENFIGNKEVSGSIALRIGELAGADAVLTGTVSQYKDDIKITARLIKVYDKSIVMSDDAFAEDNLFSIDSASKLFTKKC